jgi:dTDP-4-dehydrorhamnose reductase
VKRFLILGARGQLGVELQNAFSGAGAVTALDRSACDLADPSSIRAAIRDSRPHVILNAAAYTAVDRAESEQDLAMRINGDAPGILADEAKKTNALLIHYSTDYVFDGSKCGSWVEDDPVHPLNAYGLTKLEGERHIQRAGGCYLIFRTSWVFSSHGHNFLRTMLRLGQEHDKLNIVNDQKGAPTSAAALAAATRSLVAANPNAENSGIYHMTCAGETTWFGFSQAIFAKSEAAKAWPPVTGIPSSEYPTPARRPANSVLSNQKLKAAFGIELQSWESAMDAELRKLGILKPEISGKNLRQP